MTKFKDLKIIDELLEAVEDSGYIQPTPIQEEAIPAVLDGRDVLGCAATGTGKTAAFALPLLQRLQTDQQQGIILTLTPTRELAEQVAESFSQYAQKINCTVALIVGGVPITPQIDLLQSGVQVVVATPGRLLDLINREVFNPDLVGALVLDEADKMLDMGFADEVEDIVKRLPEQRQSLFFSATMGPAMIALAQKVVKNPVPIKVNLPTEVAEGVREQLYIVVHERKRPLLRYLLMRNGWGKALVFTRTKKHADWVAGYLTRRKIYAVAIHGDKRMSVRKRSMDHFKAGKARVLVATDVAARGLDLDGVTHVINFDMPLEVETYIHRVGRTARAGKKGLAMTLCAPSERDLLENVENFIKRKLPLETDHPYHNFYPKPPEVKDQKNTTREKYKAPKKKKRRRK